MSLPNISPVILDEALVRTKASLRAAEEAAWRASFVPHAIIVTDRDRPHPLFVAFALGVDQLIRIDLDQDAGPLTFPTRALRAIARKLARWGSDQLPAFGHPTGFIVNYSPDRAVQFDLEGEPMLVFDEAHKPGRVQIQIGKRPITEAERGLIAGHSDRRAQDQLPCGVSREPGFITGEQPLSAHRGADS